MNSIDMLRAGSRPKKNGGGGGIVIFNFRWGAGACYPGARFPGEFSILICGLWNGNFKFIIIWRLHHIIITKPDCILNLYSTLLYWFNWFRRGKTWRPLNTVKPEEISGFSQTSLLPISFLCILVNGVPPPFCISGEKGPHFIDFFLPFLTLPFFHSPLLLFAYIENPQLQVAIDTLHTPRCC